MNVLNEGIGSITKNNIKEWIHNLKDYGIPKVKMIMFIGKRHGNKKRILKFKKDRHMSRLVKRIYV